DSWAAPRRAAGISGVGKTAPPMPGVCPQFSVGDAMNNDTAGEWVATSLIGAVVKAEQMGLHWLKFASTMGRNLRAWVRGQTSARHQPAMWPLLASSRQWRAASQFTSICSPVLMGRGNVWTTAAIRGE